jgi:hypothetical protein
MTCDEYRPSRRRIAPFSPFGAVSYAATIASFYSGLNDRRDGRGEGPPADRGPDEDEAARPGPLAGVSSPRPSADTSTRISDHALCCEPLTLKLSHVILTERETSWGVATASAMTAS